MWKRPADHRRDGSTSFLFDIIYNPHPLRQAYPEYLFKNNSALFTRSICLPESPFIHIYNSELGGLSEFHLAVQSLESKAASVTGSSNAQ
jgi:hypothetical protein